MWPFEWRYFTEFFAQYSNNKDVAHLSELIENFCPIAQRFDRTEFSTYYSSISVKGNIDSEKLIRDLGEGDEDLSSEEFLHRIFQGFASQMVMADVHPCKYGLKCMTKGFDWRDTDLIDRSKLIYTMRPIEIRYKSQRGKFIEKFHCGAVETLERCKRLHFENRLNEEVLKRYGSHPNFKIVELSDLKSDSKLVMREIAEFVEIDWNDSLISPTFLGKTFLGHFHNCSLNRGGIQNQESVYPSLTSYERILLESVQQADLPSVSSLQAILADSLTEELPKIFPDVTSKETERCEKIFLEHYQELEKYFSEPLLNQGYADLKVKYPYIL